MPVPAVQLPHKLEALAGKQAQSLRDKCAFPDGEIQQLWQFLNSIATWLNRLNFPLTSGALTETRCMLAAPARLKNV